MRVGGVMKKATMNQFVCLSFAITHFISFWIQRDDSFFIVANVWLLGVSIIGSLDTEKDK